MVITETPTGKELIGSDVLTIKGTATNPDDNKMWIDVQVNKQSIQTIPVENDVWSFSFAIDELAKGENMITLTAREQYDATYTKQVRIHRHIESTPAQEQVMRYELDTLKAINAFTMWVKHLADVEVQAEVSSDISR